MTPRECAGLEARQIVRDGLRAAGLMPRQLPPRRHPASRRPYQLVTSMWPGARGEHRVTPGDLPGENGLPDVDARIFHGRPLTW